MAEGLDPLSKGARWNQSSGAKDPDGMRRVVSFSNVNAFASMPLGSNVHLRARTDRDMFIQSEETGQMGVHGMNGVADGQQGRFRTKKLGIVMVGLPARGKSHIARCLERYLNWLGFAAKVFNVGVYRRLLLGARQSAEFFDPQNEEGREARKELAWECLKDMLEWLNQGGLVGIYDATNSTIERRAFVRERLEENGVRVLILESICTDSTIIEKNIYETKLRSPDYANVSPEEAVEDFEKRLAHYDSVNETVADKEGLSYIKIINVGRQIILNDIQGYVQGKIVSYVLNTHIMSRNIYLSRHGESEWNVTGQLGGDPDLTIRGRLYAKRLAEFMRQQFTDRGRDLPAVWTSQLLRTRQTVEHIPTMNLCWRALNEIDAGMCEGLTYKQVRERHPEVAAARQADKLRYRYPGGESYVDVIARLEPVILELERQRGPVLIVGHNAIIRAIYAYFMGLKQEECPFLDIPLHTIFRLTTRAYGAEERRFQLDVENTDNNRTSDSSSEENPGLHVSGLSFNTTPDFLAQPDDLTPRSAKRR